MRTCIVVGLLALCALPAAGQISAEHVAPPPPSDLESPMKLTIPLGPDDKHPSSVLDLPVNHSRRFTQTAQFVVDKMRVTEVRIGKRQGRGQKENIDLTLFLTTEYFRQKIDISVALVGDSGSVWKWQDPEYVLGFTAGDVIGGGALGIATASKAAKIQQSIPLTEDMRKSLGANPHLEIVVAIVP
jgi:hypothetical protein